MKWLEGLSPLRFALLVIAAFAVAASLAWSFAHERHDEPHPLTPQTVCCPVPTEVDP